MKTDTEELFWAKVKRTVDSCWEWQASFDSKGYGQFHVRPKMHRVHRFAYEIINGMIPKNLSVVQICGNRRCARPSHLAAKTKSEISLNYWDITGRKTPQKRLAKQRERKSKEKPEERQKTLVRQKTYREQNKSLLAEKRRDKRLQSKYNMSTDDYGALSEQQNDCCLICGLHSNDCGKLVVDHNHLTGKVRGLLCDRCNLGMGCLRDDKRLLQNAVKYLEQFDEDS